MGSSSVEDEAKHRLKDLLKETITLLCKNGLKYNISCGVEALIGITLDEKEVFLVNINESLRVANANTSGNGSRKRRYSDEEVEVKGDSTPVPHRKRHRTVQVQSKPSREQTNKCTVKKENVFIENTIADADVRVPVVKQEPNMEVSFDVHAGLEAPSHPIHNLSHGEGYGSGEQPVFPVRLPYSSDSIGYDMLLASQSVDARGVDASAQQINTYSLLNKKSKETSSNRISGGSSTVVCEYCLQEFKFRQTLRDHQRNRHGIGEPFVCECGERIMDRRRFAQHRKRHELELRTSSHNEKNDTEEYALPSENEQATNPSDGHVRDPIESGLQSPVETTPTELTTQYDNDTEVS